MSNRIRAMAAFVPEAETVADIGCDHGFLCAELLSAGKAARTIACDISGPSLEKARSLLRASFPARMFDCRLGDGLSVLAPGEADVLVIAGMGGMRIQRILREGESAARRARIVVGPQKNTEQTRRFLAENGYEIEKETVIESAGRFYPLLLARSGTPAEESDDFWYFLGRRLLEDPPACIGRYLAVQAELLKKAAADERARQFLRRVEQIRKELS